MKSLIKSSLLTVMFFFGYLYLEAQIYNMPYKGTQEIVAHTGLVYDNGGPSGNYSNNSNDILVIRPDSAGAKVRLIFNYLNVESCCDKLYIYNGASTSSGLIGSYSSSPGYIYSTDTSGALTIHFMSDGSVTNNGFEIQIGLYDSSIKQDVMATNCYLNKSSVVAGQEVRYTTNVLNASPVPVDSLKVEYYLSVDTIPDEGDVLLSTWYMGYIYASGTRNKNQYLSIPVNTLGGDYYVVGAIVSTEGEYDYNPENNVFYSPLHVEEASVDLSVRELTFEPNIFESNKSSQITLKYFNEGNTAVNGVHTNFYLSSDTSYSENDIFLGSNYLSYCPANYLFRANASLTVPYSDTLDTGVYYLYCIVDEDSAIDETDEGNNIFLTEALYVKGNQEEYGINVAIDTLVMANDTISTSSFFITGLSVKSTSRSVIKCDFYLSDDNLFNKDEDTLIYSNYKYVMPSDTFQVYNLEIGMIYDSVPKDYGKKYLFTEIDYTTDIDETDETDNIAYTEFYLDSSGYMDLILTDSYLSEDSLYISGYLTIYTTMQNIGTGSLDQYINVGYYLSNDTLLDSADLFLGSDYEYRLAIGEKSREYHNISLSGKSPGAYYILCAADYSGEVKEKNEGNNVVSLPFYIYEHVFHDSLDISITEVSCPDSAEASQYINVTMEGFYITNEPMNVKFGCYLSEDNVFDVSDISTQLFNTSRYFNGSGKYKVSSNFRLPVDITEGNYYLIFKADLDNIVFEGSEANNVIIKPIKIGQAEVDLKLNRLDIPMVTLYNGSRVSGSYAIYNYSEVMADTALATCYITSGPVLTEGAGTIFTDTLYHLGPYSSKLNNFNIVLPDTLSNGLYYIWLNVVAANSVSETNLSNNSKRQAIGIHDPDIDLDILSSVPIDSLAFQGELLRMKVNVANLGTTSPPNSYVSFFLSTDDVFSDDDRELTSYLCQSLGIMHEKEFIVSFKLPSDVPVGTYSLFSVIDPDNNVTETLEDNNTFMTEIEIYPSGADLSPTGITFEDSRVIPGKYMNTNTSIINYGNQLSSRSSSRYYLSKDNNLDAGDKLLYTSNVYSIYPGYTDNDYNSIYIDTDIDTGSYYLIVKVDSDNQIVELDETNNTYGVEFTIVAPSYDYHISGTSQTDTLYLTRGGSSTLNCYIGNLGNDRSDKSIYIGQYLSTDEVFNPLEDAFIGSDYVYSIYPGNISSVQINNKVPSSIPIGNYYSFFVADYNNQVDEVNEENNVFMLPVAVVEPDVDLVISEFIELPDTISFGDKMYINFSVLNQGTTIAELSTTTKVYLSLDTIPDSDDYSVFTRYTSSLNPGESYLVNSSFYTSNSPLSGELYAIAVADYYDRVDETNETNNISYQKIYITEPDIDLEIQNLTLSKNIVSGGNYVDVYATVLNSGTTQTNRSGYVGYYLSTDLELDNSDYLLDSDYIGYLKGGNSIETHSSIWIPDYYSPGQYYLLAVADYSERVFETDEGNNMASANLIVGGAGLLVDYQMPYHEVDYDEDSISFYLYISNEGMLSNEDSLFIIVGLSNTNSTYADYLYSEDTLWVGTLSQYGHGTMKASLKLPEETYKYIIFNLTSIGAGTDINVDNNTLVVPLDVDYLIESSTLAYTADSIKYNLTIRNEGSGDGQDFSYAIMALSNDPYLDLSEDYYVDSIVVDIIPGGESATLYYETESPDSLYQYFIVSVDHWDHVAEYNEMNNTKVYTSVDYSFSETNISLVADTLNIDVETVNTGAFDARRACSAGIIFSTDSIYSNDDLLMGHIVVDPVGAGGSAADSFKALVPDAMYNYLILFMDIQNDIFELDEQNNLVVLPLSTIDYFDFSVEEPLTVETVICGETVPVDLTIKNIGNVESGSSDISYYLSDDEILDNADNKLLNVDISSIPAEGKLSVHHEVQIPENLSIGGYVLIYVVNEDNSTDEKFSDNNSGKIFLDVNKITSIGYKHNDGNALMLYPNPASDYIKINKYVGPAKYKIINSQGAMVNSGIIDHEKQIINISNLNEGLYFIVIKHSSTEEIHKFEVIR